MTRHFLRLGDLDRPALEALLARAAAHKADRRAGRFQPTLTGKTLVLLFEKASTRTRVSFEAAMAQLGGSAISLPWSESQAARGEPLEDTARVLSRYADAIAFRTHGEERLFALAGAATVPVINALTDQGHPVQVLTDLFTVQERFGALDGRTVAWVGDGASNMARSWAEAAAIFDVELRMASPAGYELPPELRHDRIRVCATPAEAVRGAEVVCTDTWTSMGQEAEEERRRAAFQGYTVDQALLAHAPSAIVLHCLPAVRGEEITAEVLEGPQSAVFDQAENRLHVQKALLEHLLLG
ncbi:MAG TPA: ornithine carbamoyltransferase [Fredinandcohnia sp.]|nr:ornithine carbamoyltransferase [Fredinandcohnia sp.]